MQQTKKATTIPATPQYFPKYDFCSICKGECWKSNDNAATQVAALKKFGIIPNKCVNASTGQSFCPNA